MAIRAILQVIYKKCSKVKRTYKAIRGAKKIAFGPSYFPELNQKSVKTKIRENTTWARRYGEVNLFYSLYGFDIVGLRNQDEYIDYYSFMTSRDEINKAGAWWSYLALLRDKFLFYKVLSSNNIPTPSIFAVTRNGLLYNESMEPIPWEGISGEKDYFVKDIDGECASFVKHIKDYNELVLLKEKLQKGGYVFQRRLEQHAGMNIINPEAINTLRLVTINKDGMPYVLSSLLRVGTQKTGCVDNWAAGGLAIGIEDDGHLKEFGFYKPTHGTKTSIHPDTGIVFKDFIIPEYQEARELVCKAHRCFYGIRAIGWDVAITKDGPMLIEGNDNFEISMQQACDRPLKKEWNEVCR